MPNEILTRAIDALCEGTHLSTDHASAVLDEIMEGRAAEVETGAFLVALRTKGETVAELVGLARTMRRLATPVDVDREGLVDTAGTGGGASTFNVSTLAALIAAGAGARVAKHGNRSATSRSGSADVLEALGVSIELDPEGVARCVEEVGFGFMFAPRHHAATRHVVPVRKALGVRTIFNLLGPLTNPAGASRQVVGVADRTYQETVAEALAALGCRHALVVNADDGVDEIGVSDATRIVEVREGRTGELTVTPEEIGLRRWPLETLAGAEPEDNARVARKVLEGEHGPARDFALANAAAAIVAADLAPDLPAGVEVAARAVDTGAAAGVLDRLVALTNELAG